MTAYTAIVVDLATLRERRVRGESISAWELAVEGFRAAYPDATAVFLGTIQGDVVDSNLTEFDDTIVYLFETPRLPLEHLLLEAMEDYSADGSLSERDVDRWATTVAGQIRAGDPINTISEEEP